MGKLRQALFALTRRLYALFLPVGMLGGELIPAADDRGVTDGVDYSQPFVLPGYARRDMAKNPALANAVATALREAGEEQYRSQFGDPYVKDVPFSPTMEDPLMEWDISTRERVLSNCHAAFNRNPLANSVVQFTTQFVVGDGFNLNFKNKDVERIVQAFIDNPENAVREYERQAVTDLQVDGELFLQMFEDGGETVIAPRRPWECLYITTEKGFFRRVKSYHFQRTDTEGDAPTGTQETVIEPVPAEQMLYVAINRHAYELRGRPDLYRLLPWLRADTEWLSDRARQSKWRNALLWVVQVANATQEGVARVAAKWRKPPAPGSVYVGSANETVTAATNSSNASDAMNDGRALRLQVIMGARLPEYFFGDGKQSNLATATKQELPALTKFETFQQIMISQLWTPLFKRVIQNAVDAGFPLRVPVQDADGETMKDGQETVLAVDAFEVTYEPVTAQDILNLTNALSKQAAHGWIDDVTAMEKLGNNPHMVQKRLAKQRQQAQAEMAQGLRVMPPGGDGGLGMGRVQPDEARQRERVPDAV